MDPITIINIIKVLLIIINDAVAINNAVAGVVQKAERLYVTMFMEDYHTKKFKLLCTVLLSDIYILASLAGAWFTKATGPLIYDEGIQDPTTDIYRNGWFVLPEDGWEKLGGKYVAIEGSPNNTTIATMPTTATHSGKKWLFTIFGRSAV